MKVLFKELLILFILSALLLSLAFCQHSGKTDHVAIDLGVSDQFSSVEIEEAVNCVIQEFKDFDGCTLTALWYDETKSNTEVEKSSFGANKADVIVLYSNFTVDASGGEGNLDPSTTYTDFGWILIRDRVTGEWVVKTYGYA